MSTNPSDVVGYLIWRQSPDGKPTLSKIDKEIHDGACQVSPQKVKDEAISQIGRKIPLTEKEFKWDLETLEAKYPCPPIPSSNK